MTNFLFNLYGLLTALGVHSDISNDMRNFIKRAGGAAIAVSCGIVLLLAGCGGNAGKNTAAEAPPPAQVEHEGDANLVQVDHPDQFPLVAATEYKAPRRLVATGVVSPDISRTVPVISIAAGRVVEIRARLGDTVKKGQVLLRVQSADIAGAYSDYRKALADEILANKQLDRAKGLYDHGAISLNDLQVAEDTENKAKVDVETTAEHLRVLGSPARSSFRDSGYRRAGFRRDYRPASYQRRRSSGTFCLREPLHDFGSFLRLDSLRCV